LRRFDEGAEVFVQGGGGRDGGGLDKAEGDEEVEDGFHFLGEVGARIVDQGGAVVGCVCGDVVGVALFVRSVSDWSLVYEWKLRAGWRRERGKGRNIPRRRDALPHASRMHDSVAEPCPLYDPSRVAAA